ncbi:hypothetical protein SAMN05216548_11453 [Faunimonas pinastri]|uniref:Uncharacterized protein n=1 Tax=Faunimonas pinastri TaxID=1855383 RepID=A0A1H9MUL5_9HYPH|nr:hypothetical protein [Faunimonas pinastri]SER27281.1 hypothetical protein SAMN05216548_11453 [Faunimonas pinastri]
MRSTMKKMLDALPILNPEINKLIGSISLSLSDGGVIATDSVILDGTSIYARVRESSDIVWIDQDDLIGMRVEFNEAACKAYEVEPTIPAILNWAKTTW